MILVENLKNKPEEYDLPQEFVDCLPSVCPSCGALTEVSESLTGLRCSNPFCFDKVAKRIEAICNSLGILGFGENTIVKYVEQYQITNPLKIFQLTPGDILADDVSEVVSEKIIEQIMAKKDFQLWEYVKIANLPDIQTSAKEIFSGYEILEDAYADIEDGGVSFIQNRLGINDEVISVRAAKIYASLMTFKDSLFECVNDVNIINLEQEGIIELDVVCSDKVGGGFAKKKDFYEYVNNLLNGRVHVNFLSSVKKSIDYLVWAGADGSPASYTSKVRTVEKYNSKDCNIPILTATQFIEEMKSKYL